MEASIKNDQGHTPTGNYHLSRFNATRHGILSRHTVLPWESPDEYEELHGALKQEHKPHGPTEEHLVEELAGIIWRKRRLRLAESAAYRDQYCRALTYDSERIVEAGILNEGRLMTKERLQEFSLSDFTEKAGLPEPRLGRFRSSSNTRGDYDYVEEVFSLGAEEAAQKLAEVTKDIHCCQEALEILRTSSSEAYQRAVDTLIPDTQAFWLEQVADQSYQPTPEGLREFLYWVMSDARRQTALLANLRAIRAQAQGESFNPDRLEIISRYEVSLDRKMEKTLAMLLKLQELGRGRDSALG